MRTITIREMRYKLDLTSSVCEPVANVRWLRHHNTLLHPALRLEYTHLPEKDLLPLSLRHTVLLSVLLMSRPVAPDT
jgi:hypothetical protein